MVEARGGCEAVSDNPISYSDYTHFIVLYLLLGIAKQLYTDNSKYAI